MSVVQILPNTERSEALAARLRQFVEDAAELHADGFGGFALVTWDMRGGVRTAYDTNAGPVSHALMPAFAHDALNRHVAVVLAHTETLESAG